jgi:hypothetical protein
MEEDGLLDGRKYSVNNNDSLIRQVPPKKIKKKNNEEYLNLKT